MRPFALIAAVLFLAGICFLSQPLLAADPKIAPGTENASTAVTANSEPAAEASTPAAVDAEESGDDTGDDDGAPADAIKGGEVLPSDPACVARLESFFNPIQDNPEYYSDRKCRKKLDARTAEDLARYKPNFGKKIWVRSHYADTIEQNAADLGDLYASRTYKMSALEIEENVAPHLEEYLKNKNIDFQKWADTFEMWGRTYVDPSSGGKKRSTFIVKDYRNGNFLILKPRRGKQVCYFIAERFQEIVNGMLTYTPLAEKKKKK